jgi:hypothetical protein
MLIRILQKPVSSLRSHFEQMANAKGTSTTPRAVSPKPAPKPTSKNTGAADPVKPIVGRDVTVSAVEEGLGSSRGRERDALNGLQLPARSGSVNNLSPSPTRFRPRPLSTTQPLPKPPALTIEPPQSPPKVRTLNLALANPSTYLSADSPVSAASGRSSPGHFRIPSRPHTPTLEAGRSPTLRAIQPPSPPPPRRSGELRRDPSVKAGPPIVKRAEKPKVAIKPLSLQPGHQIPEEGSSPFSTPPGSDESPENELLPPALPPNRPQIANHSNSASPITSRTFEPPLIHPMVINKWRDHEVNGQTRGNITPQVTGDQRPALPIRPQVSSEAPKSRPLSHTLMPPPPPPPPRASLDRARPPMTSIDTTSYSTPPKRVFSTPTNQVPTPPRSHGRSMTVDRASDRTPTEFRQPLSIVPARSDPRSSIDVAPQGSSAKETSSQNYTEYPDFSHSNRRTPYFRQGLCEIPTGYETRIHDVCGEYICTSGHVTRVWNSHDGELIMTLPTNSPGADQTKTKIISVAFKTSSDIRDEGSRLWLGNNIGELLEVDIASQSVVMTKANAHTRRDIIKIYRHKTEMWTLDDGGTLNLWAPDKSGSPNLTNPSTTFRVPKGHTFSMVVGDELWIAAGKEIRIFLPTMDMNVQFQVLQQPLGQSASTDVTSGAVINTQPDLVYFGHVDGKVSVYSRQDYTCLGIFNVSQYKITCLTGVGGKLWAGISDGHIYVYDTAITPWAVKKDWLAHNKAVISMVADRRSFWSLDCQQVISLGQDNMLQIWDGLLEEDWIGLCISTPLLNHANKP